MSCKTESTQIGNHEYSVTQWPAEKSVLMKFRLAKALGSSLSKIATALSSNNVTKEDKMAAFSEGVSELFKNSSPEELSKLIKDCVVNGYCDGTMITETSYNELFSGDSIADLYKVFFFVIKVNYGNFIPARMGAKFQEEVNKITEEEEQNSQT